VRCPSSTSTMSSRSPSSRSRCVRPPARAWVRLPHARATRACRRAEPRAGRRVPHARRVYACMLRTARAQVAIEAADTRTVADLKALFVDTYNAKFGLVRPQPRLPPCPTRVVAPTAPPRSLSLSRAQSCLGDLSPLTPARLRHVCITRTQLRTTRTWTRQTLCSSRRRRSSSIPAR